MGAIRGVAISMILLLGLLAAPARAEIAVTFVAPDATSGLTLRNFDDNMASFVYAGGVPVVRTSFSGFLYFDVDDGYIRNGSYRFATVEIDYFDGSDQVGRSFFLQYDAAGGAYATTERVYLTGGDTFKVARFHLDQVRFDNQQRGTDFRIVDEQMGLRVRRVAVIRASADPRAGYAAATSVGFQAPATTNGLALKVGADGVVGATTEYGRQAIRVSPQGRAYFDVDDTFAKDGRVGEVIVTVSYYDQGYGTFSVHYDSLSSLATSAEMQAHWPAAGVSSAVATNNVVWLTNSRAWKTASFYLTNVRFSNRQLNGSADLRIVQEVGTEYQAANDGYLLAVDGVTVTRPSRQLDRSASFGQAGAGGGLPVFVWTRLAETNEGGHGLWQNEAAGPTTRVTIGGEEARAATSGLIAFDVNDTYIKNGNARDAFVTVEYFDSGTGTFGLQYDSTSQANRATPLIARGDTNQWRRATFYLSDAYFSNAQANGSDFVIVAPASDLYARAVYVARAPGIALTPSDAPGDGPLGSVRERAVAALYYPIYDGRFPAQWERGTMGPPGANVQRIATTYSWRDVEALRQDLVDMRAAGIDAALVAYSGNTSDGNGRAILALRNLVAAAATLGDPPRLGLLLDPQSLYAERVLREARTPLDLTDPTTAGLLLKGAQDFFSQVPRERWFTMGGRPVLLLQYRGADIVARYDQAFLERLRARFAAALGVPPYVIADSRWDRLPAALVDDWYQATPGLSPVSQPGYTTTGIASLSPGFDDGVPGRLRDREGGAFYDRGWERVLGKGPHLVVIDSWNHWSDGTAIAESAEYGRAYVEGTARQSGAFKVVDYSGAASVKITLGETNTPQGLWQDEIPQGLTTTGVWGGAEGRRPRSTAMFFSVHDGLLLHRPARVRVTVRYFDAEPSSAGADWFTVVYDSTRGPNSLPEPSEIATAYLSGSRTWKTHTWELGDVLFANRQAGANDFHLESSVGLAVSEVTVTPVNRIFAPIIQQAPSPAP